MSFEALTIESTCLYTLHNEGPKNLRELVIECQAHVDPLPAPLDVLARLNHMVETGQLEIVTPATPAEDAVYGVKSK